MTQFWQWWSRGTRFVIYFAYLFQCHILHPPDSSFLIAPLTYITAQDESFTAHNSLDWKHLSKDGPEVTFCDFNRLFFQSITFGAPLTTLTRQPFSHRLQHKMICSQHSTFSIENILAKMIPVSRFVISIAYFIEVSHSAPPWQLSYDSPPPIDHSTTWIVHNTALSRLN